MAVTSDISYLVLLTLSMLQFASPFNLDHQFPIVYEDPTLHRTRGTYFGFSVMLYGSKTTKSWIMVGAPRANSTFENHREVNEPGVIYRCSFWPPQKCEPLLLDKSGNDMYRGFGYKYWELKDGAWFGAAMDVQPGVGGRVVVCGPRWINQGYLNAHEDYYMLGACYWFEAEQDVLDGNAVKMLPLLNDARITKQWGNSAIYDFGVGECGISVHMPLKKGIEEGSELLIGAPGILNWRGGTILSEDDNSLPRGGFNKRSAAYGVFSNTYVPPATPSKDNHLRAFDYFGYQMNSGYFFNEDELWYATSAPRATNILGKVLFYKVRKGMESNYQVIRVDKNYQVLGIQCGEYFGASIAVGNINDDIFEDLIVGAPLYASESRSDGGGLGVEEGRISVFFGSETKQMREVPIFGKARGARFGSAVSYLGDLDSDGFGEIAVGAPYENEGRGAVYIFSGSKNGIITKPVQQLFANDIYQHLRGFGSSISPHPADIDGNGCTDVAVGAYQSGHAVVFRGRPVVKWKVNTPQYKVRIPRNATQFSLLGACVTYLGNNVPNNLTIWRTLDLDPLLKRCHIENQMIFAEKLTLKRGVEHCDNILIDIKESKTKNVIEPIEIRIKYQLEEEMLLEKYGYDRTREEFKTQHVLIKADGILDATDRFCKSCPVSKGSTERVVSIPFEVGCGVDEICLADLVITGKLPQLNTSDSAETPEFVIGSSKTLKFNIYVSNKGEPAYLTQVYIELGSPGKIARIPPECHEVAHLSFMEVKPENSDSTTTASQHYNTTGNGDRALGGTDGHCTKKAGSICLRCDLDNPLPTNSARGQLVEIDMKNVHDSTGMNLFTYVTTISQESNPENNLWRTYIPFTYKADMEVIGRAGRNDLFTYFKENKNESESKIKFNHIYEVHKYGYSPVHKINIILQIPVSMKAEGSGGQINFLRLITTEGSQSGQSFPCSQLDDAEGSKQGDTLYGGRDVLLISNYSTTQVPSNRTLYLNCSSLSRKDEHSVKCISVSCAAGPFPNLQTVAKILLEMELDVLSLEKVMGLRDIILLETQGFVQVIEPIGLIQPKNGRADISWASTRFIGDIPKKHVESWVVALAIGGGIMLLLFVAMAMHKAGFFERKKKEELKSLKRKTLAEYAMHANEDQDQEVEQSAVG